MNQDKLSHEWPEENDRVEQVEWMAREADEAYDNTHVTFGDVHGQGWTAERYAVELVDNYIKMSESMPTWFDKVDRAWMIERIESRCAAA